MEPEHITALRRKLQAAEDRMHAVQPDPAHPGYREDQRASRLPDDHAEVIARRTAVDAARAELDAALASQSEE